MKHNQTLRRGLGILLSLVMCLSLLPATALAADPATETADFTDGDGSAALTLLTANGGTATWSENKLTLNDVNFTTSAATAVKFSAGATIELVGDNTITSTSLSTDAFSSCGIYATGDLAIGGSGTLTVTGGTTTTKNGLSCGINSSTMTISDTAKVTATGGEAAGENSKSYGILSTGMTISDAAEVTARVARRQVNKVKATASMQPVP